MAFGPMSIRRCRIPAGAQATEEVLGTAQRRPTQIFNGYGEFVAGLYTGLENEPLYM